MKAVLDVFYYRLLLIATVLGIMGVFTLYLTLISYIQ